MQNRLRKLLAKLPLVKADEHDGGELRVEATLPGLGPQPFLSLQARLQREAGDDGERTRIQARVDARFAALSLGGETAPADAEALAGPGGRRGLALYRKGLRSPLVQTALAPLRRLRLSQWLDLQSTTHPLHRGAASLFPARLSEVGAKRAADGPPLQAWMAELPGGNGIAQVTTLALDKDDLPAPARQRIGRRPFHLAATLVQTAEEDFS